MTAQILAAELTTLIQESKRKNSELRNAAEKSLSDLRGLPATSEAQLAGDLNRRSHFINPFLVACFSGSSKLILPGATCLQRLAVSAALPRDRLSDVLEALNACSSAGSDVQLRILQILPALTQNYPAELKDDALSSVLQLCSTLQSVRAYAISNTATATLQQLVTSAFDKVATEDERAEEISTTTEVQGEDGPVAVRPAALDAYKVLHDICRLVVDEEPSYVRFTSVSQTGELELIEAILSEHERLFSVHSELRTLLRDMLLPFLNEVLSTKTAFAVTVRCFRLHGLLLRRYIRAMSGAAEKALSLVVGMIESDSTVLWKRTLCVELLKDLLSDPAVILEVYSQCDALEGRRDTIRDMLSAFVRLSTEKPAVIALGQQSSAPVGNFSVHDSTAEQAAIEASAVAGAISGTLTTTNASGISMQNSMLRTPYIDCLDKPEPPTAPESYIYGLVLTCLNTLSESLARFILPLTLPEDSRSRRKHRTKDVHETSDIASSESPGPPVPKGRLRRTSSYKRRNLPVNPMTLENHPFIADIRNCAALITECWPALLATSSTFLNAALDTDFYRALVRSIQKMTQVSGLLGLSTPRDAFLTTLGKAAVPPHLLNASMSPRSTTAESAGVFSNPKGLLSVDSVVSQTSTMAGDRNSRRQSVDAGVPTLTTRNLLCLRALLNLAIALGPTLGSAWSIVLENLQQADIVMAVSTPKLGAREFRANLKGSGTSEVESVLQNFSSEAGAVQAAASRLFESTVDYPDDAFLAVLSALCSLLHGRATASAIPKGSTIRPPAPSHSRRVGSFSGISVDTESQNRDYTSALRKVGDLAALNIGRLITGRSDESGWDLLLSELTKVAVRSDVAGNARQLAAEIVGRVILESAKLSASEPSDYSRRTQQQCLTAMLAVIDPLHDEPSDELHEVDVEIHRVMLDALRSILEHCGESLTAGWESVFAIAGSIFEPDSTANPDGASHNVSINGKATPAQGIDTPDIKAIELLRPAFGSLQLICSDFLSAVPDEQIPALIQLLAKYCMQDDDLNISLTSIGFFWNVSDFLQQRADVGSISNADEMTDKTVLVEDWLSLLTRLGTIVADSRSEVRNGVIQTILRIFDNCGDRLSHDAWSVCFHRILLPVLTLNSKQQADLRQVEEPKTTEQMASSDETTKVLILGAANLFSTFLGAIADGDHFPRLWEKLLLLFNDYLSLQAYPLSTVVYMGLSSILTKVDNPTKIGNEAVQRAFNLWSENAPSSRTDGASDDQAAFLAYAKCTQELYRLMEASIAVNDITTIVHNLRSCIEGSSAGAYTADVDRLTPLQTHIAQIFSKLRMDMDGAPSHFLHELSALIHLPFDRAKKTVPSGGPTYVAFAKTTMDLMRITTLNNIARREMFTSGALQLALNSLARPIELKYNWPRPGKPPTTWQKAIEVALEAIPPILTQAHSLSIPNEITNTIWSSIVAISSAIANADLPFPPPPTPTIWADEDIEIAALRTLTSTIIPSLGSPSISDSLRRAFCAALFRASIVHSPSPYETYDLDSAPLQGLYDIQFGRTYDPPPTPRIEMAYHCFELLLSFVRLQSSTPAEVALARAAAPYVILRAALPLKAYIADQSLRGRIPMPQTARREIVWTLKRMMELESEPKAIPECEGVRSALKRHLHRLYPLVVKALRVKVKGEWEGDVADMLGRFVEGVGEGFGVDM